MNRRRLILPLSAVVVLAAVIVATQVEVSSTIDRSEVNERPGGDPALEERMAGAYARLPLSFVENRGQSDPQVRYLAQGDRHGFFLTSESLAMSFLEQDGEQGVNLSLEFVGADRDVSVDAADRTPGTVNYLRADDGSGGHTGLATFGEVVYDELWPGVDMAVRGQDGILKYEFRVQPGARVDDIRLSYRGANGMEQDASGGLVVDTAIGALRDSPPVSYQVIDGERVAVDSHYVLEEGELSYGFAVGDHDPNRELVIDPGLAYSTFLGGFGNQVGEAIVVDPAGNAYITGFTQSPTFPTTPGAFDRSGSANNDLDVFVTKLDPTGSALVYSTFLGGSDFEWGRDLDIDRDGNAYIAGQTKSSNFPTTAGAFDTTINTRGDCPRCGLEVYDAFVTKLNPTGSALVYSTYLGGRGLDDALAIDVDDTGRAHVAGQTASSNFPTTSGSFDTSANGGFDAFVTRVNASGSGLVYSTYLGGGDNELPSGIAVDSSGNAVVVGGTRSADFPSTPGVLDPTHGGGDFLELFDGFITKLNPAGSDLVYSTFLGGTKRDSVGDVDLDASGNAYLVGATSSPEFPTTAGAFDPTFDGSGETFVAKLNPTGSAFEYSTFFGEAGASALAVDVDGSVWLAGGTSSPTTFVTSDAWDPQFSGGSSDAYLAKLDPGGSALQYATFLGGTESEGARDVALDPDGNVYVSGRTLSADFPITEGAVDSVYSGDPFISGAEGFVAKFTVGADAPAPPPPPPPIPGAPDLVSPDDGATVDQPVTFDWTDVADAVSYTIQVDEISAFGEPLILSQDVAGSELTTGDIPEGTWFWRVRGVNSAGTPGPWSEVRTITVATETPPPPPDAPSLVSPVDGAQVTQPFTFDWTDVEGAAFYRIEVDDESTFAAPHVWAATSTPSQLETTSLPDGELFWRVRAFNADGAGGPYSTVRSVQVGSTASTTTTTTTTSTTTTTTPTRLLPAPSLLSPAHDARFSPGQTITFDWTDVNGAATYTIQIDDEDNFRSPFVVEQTVSVSQQTVSGLPTTRMWWRVRANDGSGSPGNWSSIRRFELKD